MFIGARSSQIILSFLERDREIVITLKLTVLKYDAYKLTLNKTFLEFNTHLIGSYECCK